jgi:tRNA uridine 5-carboxymethylaminomethyl modification enzyme
VDTDRPPLSPQILEDAETEIRYEGYIKRQEAQLGEQRRLECLTIPADFDFRGLVGLSREAAEKLQKARPLSVAQAARISGVSPADIAVLLVALRKKNG